jgi:predicted negative regulator of RcsB-dependent stress response
MSRETPTERREAAETRRRWVTLAEVLAVAGVLIAALTLWSNWSERNADKAEKASAKAGVSKSVPSQRRTAIR